MQRIHNTRIFSLFERLLEPAILTGLLLLLMGGVAISGQLHPILVKNAGVPLTGWKNLHSFLIGINMIFGVTNIWFMWYSRHDRSPKNQPAHQAPEGYEERYQSLFHNSHTIMLLIDPATGKFIDANPAACTFYGYDREKFLELREADIQPNSPGVIQHDLAPAFPSGKARQEVCHQLSNGELREMEVHSSRVIYNHRDLWFIIAHDITERKKTEEALQFNESTLRSIFRAAPNGIGMVQNRVFGWVNDTLCKMTGYTNQELIGRSARMLYVTDDEYERVGVEKYNQIRTDGTGTIETCWRSKNGQILNILLSSTPLDLSDWSAGVIFTATDITGLKNVQKKLELSEDRYRELFDTMLSAFALHEIVLDEKGEPVDYRFLEVNPAFERLTGLQASQVVNKVVSQVMPNIEPYWIKSYGEVALTRQAARFENYSQDLQKHFEVVAYSPSPGRFATLFQDITERKQAEKQQLAILTISNHLRTADSRDDMVSIILKTASELLEAQSAALGIYQAESDEVRIEKAVGKAVNSPLAIPQSLVNQIMTSAKPLRFNPDDTDRLTNLLWAADDSPALAIAPLMAHHFPVGLLMVGRAAPFNESDLQILAGVSEIAANALQRTSMLEQTHRSLNCLEALHKIDLTIQSALDLRITLAVLLDLVITNLDVDSADVLRFNSITHTLEMAASRGFNSAAINQTHLYLGQGLAGKVALERKTLQVNDILNNEYDPRQAAMIHSEGFITYTGAPLIAKGEIKGVLEVYHRKPFSADAEWLAFMNTLAGQAAIALDNAAMFADLQRSNLELALAYDTTLEGWAKALEGRDQETEGHSRRVTDAALELGRTLGLTDDVLAHMRRGSLLHDIGKMAIPDAILHKNGPLSDDEWQIMRKHPEYACDWLAAIPFLRPALDIPRCHHEKWDGSGYPRGLKGEQIPLSARIFAVIDVWDALRSDRPYRSAWEFDKAFEYIQNQAGSHFDPKVTETFLALLSSGKLPV